MRTFAWIFVLGTLVIGCEQEGAGAATGADSGQVDAASTESLGGGGGIVPGTGGADTGAADTAVTGSGQDTQTEEDSASQVVDPPPPVQNGSPGYATRYWDCCKPHCSWKGNVSSGEPLRVCDINNDPLDNMISQWEEQRSGCDGGAAYVCWDMVPWAVGPKLAYGFVATAGNGNVQCGTCFQLDFDGGAKYGDPKASHRALAGKTMIVQATNIGYDVGSGHFDLMVPGGGVGAFANGCPAQWGTTDQSVLGAQYGGFLTTCQEKLGWDAPLDTLKQCVRDMCDTLFSKEGMDDLLAGCHWFVDWFEVADNPTFTYAEVPCPDALRARGM